MNNTNRRFEYRDLSNRQRVGFESAKEYIGRMTTDPILGIDLHEANHGDCIITFTLLNNRYFNNKRYVNVFLGANGGIYTHIKHLKRIYGMDAIEKVLARD